MRPLNLTLMLLALCGIAFAQSFALDQNRLPLMSLNGLWRFHPGDDIRWADPNVDDSSWALLRSDKPWTEQGFPELKGFVWYRFRVGMPVEEQPAALMLPQIVDDYEVYVNGRKVRSALGGTLPGLRWMPLAEAVPLDLRPAEASQPAVVAIRIWMGISRPGAISRSVSLAGRQQLITEQRQAAHATAVATYEDKTVDVITNQLIGLLVLGLFCLRYQDREYLWFAVTLLGYGAARLMDLLMNDFGRVSVSNGDFLSDLFLDVGLSGAMLFFQSILARRRTLIWWVCFVGAAGHATINALVLGVPSVNYAWAKTLFLISPIPAFLWILITLIRQAAEGNKDAQLLFVPTLGSFGWHVTITVVNWLRYQKWISDNTAHAFQSSGISVGPWHVGPAALVHVIFAASLLAFLIRRFALSRQREERLAADVEAARQIQQILLPEENPSVNGFQIESVYLPSEAVSGDFFQHIPDGHNGLLVVAGDVAGKGLQAAMLVSVLVGAIRTEASHTNDPCKILAVLNERMQGRGTNRFATCVVAHISSTGELRIANAGHIPPYLNGSPLDLPGSLPLGVAADIEYELYQFRLASGDALRFVSDGVLEAQDAAGNLLGFERTRELSRQKAQQIAKAAQEFGQKDDITVVGVDFLGAAHVAP